MSDSNKRSIIDVTHVSSRGSSYRITLPRRVAESIDLEGADDIVVFYRYDDGRIVIDKLKQL